MQPPSEASSRRSSRKIRPSVWIWIFACTFFIFMVWLSWRNDLTNHSYAHGMGYYQQGDYREAIEEFRLDVRYNPDHSLGYYYLAKSLLAQGQSHPASMEFENAYDAEMRSSTPDKPFAAKCQAEEQATLHQ